MEFIKKYKTVLLFTVLMICAFAIGRTSKLDKSNELSEQVKRGDSLRTALKIANDQKIIESIHRQTLEHAYLKEIRLRDSSHLADQVLIKKYKGIIGKQQTPHELENEMDSIFRATLNGR